MNAVKNTATPTNIIEFKNTNNVILLPLNSCGILKYNTLKSIATDSNKNITEKRFLIEGKENLLSENNNVKINNNFFHYICNAIHCYLMQI